MVLPDLVQKCEYTGSVGNIIRKRGRLPSTNRHPTHPYSHFCTGFRALNGDCPMKTKTTTPVVVTQCCDCGLGCNTAGEWFMVKEQVWAEAWHDRIKPWHWLPGQTVLCIGCLEKRLGRTLCIDDFTDAMVNSPDKASGMSDRMRSRLTAVKSVRLDEPLKRKRGRPKGSKNKPKAAAASDISNGRRGPSPAHRNAGVGCRERP